MPPQLHFELDKDCHIVLEIVVAFVESYFFDKLLSMQVLFPDSKAITMLKLICIQDEKGAVKFAELKLPDIRVFD